MIHKSIIRHPGDVLKEDYLKPLGITSIRAANALGVTKEHLRAVMKGKLTLSYELAVRLSKAFSTTPEFWLDMQTQYCLAKVDIDLDKVEVLFEPGTAEE